MFCKNCGKEISNQAAVCVNCGVAKGQGSSFCPNCGNPIAPNQVVCTNCGVALQQTTNVANGNSKSKVVAGILGIFFGVFGVHNFYLGFILPAVLQLCLTIIFIILGCCTGGITWLGNLIIFVWSFIEAILMLCGVYKVDGHGVPLK